MGVRIVLAVSLCLMLSLPLASNPPAAVASPLLNRLLGSTVTVVGSGSAAPGSFGSERVLCPANQIAIGGGIDVQNVLTMKVTSSGPTYTNGDRLLFRPDGNDAAPVGWQASARNDDSTIKSLKVAVICGQPAVGTYLPLIAR